MTLSNDQIRIHAQTVLSNLQVKCIDDVENSFNKFLLEDLSDVGFVDQVFDKENWYLYFMTCSLQLTRILDDLLLESYINRDMLLEGIKIKRVIDDKLLSYSNDDLNLIIKDLGFSTDRQEPKAILLNEEKIKSDSFLYKFWNEVVTRKWINTSFKDFESNFDKSKTSVPIEWIGRQIKLVGLVKYLINNNYVIQNESSPIDLIVTHFKPKKGLFKSTSLKVYYSQVLTSESLPEQVFDFIKYCV